MYKSIENWEFYILDGCLCDKPTGSLIAGDIDRDGNIEVITGALGALQWNRPSTGEKGVITEGPSYGVGLVLEDVDGDGMQEVVTVERENSVSSLVWYKPDKELNKWIRHEIAPDFKGGGHDIVFADVDNDGENECLVLSGYKDSEGISIFKRNGDVSLPWERYTVVEGIFAEGLAAGDLDGDGQLEIVCGPYWYKAPAEGPLSGLWDRKVFAPNFREMNRTSLIDITGNGRPDIVIMDSEYMDGGISWFENRLLENPEDPWIEHRIDNGIIYGHTLHTWKDEDGKTVHIFIAEMEQGGWGAPYNHDARLIEYISSDAGSTWQRKVMFRGEGTHQGVMCDMDNDGQIEVVGKTWAEVVPNSKLQMWKKSDSISPISLYKHSFIDRDKPATATDILATDVDGDGLMDVVCGQWWYKSPTWERYEIPGIYQVLNVYDIDGDGRDEIIAAMKPEGSKEKYSVYGADFCWIKPVDPLKGKWELHPFGKGAGDFAHGTLIAPLLPGGRNAFIACYHDTIFPEIFEVPDNPAETPWPKRNIGEFNYSEGLAAGDINGDGRIDIAGGNFWLENMGDGSFTYHKIADTVDGSRIKLMDVNGDGWLDIVVGEGTVDWGTRVTPYSRLLWLENPGNNKEQPWNIHVIDVLRCPHSLDIADLDGDGEPEIICGEHGPFWPYRSRCNLFVYKKADDKGKVWKRYTLDERFEHHCGTKAFELTPGKIAIVSHGWLDNIYVHLWAPV